MSQLPAGSRHIRAASLLNSYGAQHGDNFRLRRILALAAAIVENLGYRQLTCVWRIQGLWSQLARRNAVWGEMTRQGFDTVGEDAGVVEPPFPAVRS